MKLFEFAVKRPVAVTMIFMVVLLLGSVSLSKLGLDLFPELDLPMLVVQTTYTGAGPSEVESQITRPLEGAVGTVNGIKNISSYSSRGSSLIIAEFAWGSDLNYATNQIRDRIDIYSAMLPGDATKPMIIKMDPTMMPIIQILLSGDVELTELTKVAEDTVVPGLERVNGVASVSMDGGVVEEVRITASPQRLLAYGITFDQIINTVMMENRNVTGGTVEEALREHTIRITGEFAGIEDIQNLQIIGAGGAMVRLGDLASVEAQIKDRESYVFSDGKPGLNMVLMQQSDANLVQVSDSVHEAIKTIQDQLPPGYEMSVIFDQADYIRMSISNVVSSAVKGAVFAVLILFLFLRNVRSTMIVAVSIPMSIIATFAIMYFTEVSLNLISLGGLALGLGMIVDNSIVILENTYRFRQLGYNRRDSAINGAKEMSGAIIASTVTTIVVFFPIIFVEGMASQIFWPMALTISCALLASLAVSLILVPMLSARLLKMPNPDKVNFITKLSDAVERGLNRLNNAYRRVLKTSLRHNGKVIVATLALFVFSLTLIPKVGMEFIPEQDTGEYSVSINLPSGVALRETMRVAQQVEVLLGDIPENQRLSYTVGGSGGGMFFGGSQSNNATFNGKLVPMQERERSMDEVLDDIRERLKVLPGIEYSVSNAGAIVISGAAVAINLKGDDLQQLDFVADAVMDQIESVEGTREITKSTEEGNPEVNVVVDRQRAAQYGLSSAVVSNAVSSAVRGTTISQFRGNGEEMDIRVILDEQYRENLNDLSALIITSPTGALVPLGEVARFEIGTSPSTIVRHNQSRQVSITLDVVGRDLNSVVKDIQETIEKMTLPSNVIVEFGGSSEEMNDAFGDLSIALTLAILLVYIVMAFQFEQLLYPFVIMFSIPPTAIGVIFSLLLTGRTISVPTFIGIIMLVGIVVNNAIVLVDYINILRRDYGLERKEAILQAGPTRLRPILMTTLTTVLAMLPVAFGAGEGSEMTAPMGTALVGGLSFSTLITLILIPAMYTFMEDLTNLLKRPFMRNKAPRQEGGHS